MTRRRYVPSWEQARLEQEDAERRERRQERSNRRTDQRILDYLAEHGTSECIIPGCRDSSSFARDRVIRFPNYENPDKWLPMCARHQVIIAQQVSQTWDDPDIEAVRRERAERAVERADANAEDGLAWSKTAGLDGSIYFVDMGEYIKVGWSARLPQRLKQYGATAKVLCHYPGTRQEETDLHRTLSAHRVKGREWYEKCALIDDLVKQAIAAHGAPTVIPEWTQPKPDTAARVRRR